MLVQESTLESLDMNDYFVTAGHEKENGNIYRRNQVIWAKVLYSKHQKKAHMEQRKVNCKKHHTILRSCLQSK